MEHVYGGSADQRPFDDAIIDGFDLDIENNNPTGYAALVTKLREYFGNDEYYISAAPQCVYPDASVGDALANSYIDFAFVQFYNNPCGVDKGSGFNWDTWKDYATNTSPNKTLKSILVFLLLLLPLVLDTRLYLKLIQLCLK